MINADDVVENLMDSNWFDCDDIDVALQAVKLTDTIDPESLRSKGHWERPKIPDDVFAAICGEPYKPSLELSDLYSLAFPFDPIQEHFAGIYKRIDAEYQKKKEILDRIKVKPVERFEPVEVLDNPKVNQESFQDWLDCEKQVAISFAWVYAVILIAGLFLAFPVSIENGTRFLVDMTAIWSALFLLYTSVSLIFAIFASRRKEK